jgi:hypothetical protein
LKYPGVYERIILKWVSEKWVGGIDWIDLAEDRDKWRAVVNAVMNLRVRQNGKFFGLLRTYQLLRKASAPWSK